MSLKYKCSILKIIYFFDLKRNSYAKSIIIWLFIFPNIFNSQSIGDFYQGGVVYYVNNLGKGLIIDSSYLDASFNWTNDSKVSDWGPYATWVPGTEDEFIGAGVTNTIAFENSYSNQNYAANLCFSSISGGYNDWFLPSKDELWQVMMSISIIDSVIKIYGGDTISNGFHWSSTQVDSSNDVRYAHGTVPYTFFANGSPNGPIHSTRTKNTAHLVRAVRCIDSDCNFSSSNTNVSINLKTERTIVEVFDITGRKLKSLLPNIINLIKYDDGIIEKKILIQ